jgi:hypothetical protein
VGEHQEVARGDPIADLALPELGLLLVREQDHHDVALARRVGDRGHAKAVALRLFDRGGVLAEADHYVDAGVLQVQRMGVALRAIAEDGHGLSVELREIGVIVVDHEAGTL